MNFILQTHKKRAQKPSSGGGFDGHPVPRTLAPCESLSCSWHPVSAVCLNAEKPGHYLFRFDFVSLHIRFCLGGTRRGFLNWGSCCWSWKLESPQRWSPLWALVNVSRFLSLSEKEFRGNKVRKWGNVSLHRERRTLVGWCRLLPVSSIVCSRG